MIQKSSLRENRRIVPKVLTADIQHPPPHRLVGDIQTALDEQIFDVAIAEREPHIEPNGVPDNHRRELVAGKRDRHASSYP